MFKVWWDDLPQSKHAEVIHGHDIWGVYCAAMRDKRLSCQLNDWVCRSPASESSWRWVTFCLSKQKQWVAAVITVIRPHVLSCQKCGNKACLFSDHTVVSQYNAAVYRDMGRYQSSVLSHCLVSIELKVSFDIIRWDRQIWSFPYTLNHGFHIIKQPYIS